MDYYFRCILINNQWHNRFIIDVHAIKCFVCGMSFKRQSLLRFLYYLICNFGMQYTLLLRWFCCCFAVAAAKLLICRRPIYFEYLSGFGKWSSRDGKLQCSKYKRKKNGTKKKTPKTKLWSREVNFNITKLLSESANNFVT